MDNIKKYKLVFGLIVLIFPFFALMLYVHPQSDDYFFANKGNLLGSFSLVNDMYFNWSGRYTSMLIGSIDPFRFSPLLLTRISLFSFFAFAIFSIFFFIKSITNSTITRLRITTITLTFTIIFLNTAADIFELLYWYPSVTAYLFGVSLYLLYLSTNTYLFRNIISEKLFISIASFLSIIIIGLNELFFIPMISTAFLFTLFSKGVRRRTHITLLMVIIVFICISAFAPGNIVRAKSFDIYFLINGILTAILETINIFWEHMKNVVFILTSIVLVIFIQDKKLVQSFLFIKPVLINPILLISISIIFLVSLFLPSTLTLGFADWRFINIINFFFIALWALNLINLVWFYNLSISKNISRYSKQTIRLITIIILFTGLSTLLIPKYTPPYIKYAFKQNNIFSAYYTLLYSAKQYDNEMNEREKSYKIDAKLGKKSLTIIPIVNHTKLLMYVDYNKPIMIWQFNWEARYYEMDTIRIIQNDTVFVGLSHPNMR